LDHFPNATVAEYGEVQGEANLMKEIYARGPVACGVDASYLDDYQGGIIDHSGPTGINHIVSIVGWGVDKASGKKYWNVRNSWGEYWGEMGFFRVVRGENQLSLEEDCAWATPGTFTVRNYPCDEDGHNCQTSQEYVDPSIVPMWHME
jgi:cathepsin X